MGEITFMDIWLKTYDERRVIYIPASLDDDVVVLDDVPEGLVFDSDFIFFREDFEEIVNVAATHGVRPDFRKAAKTLPKKK